MSAGATAPLLSLRDLRYRWPGSARDQLDIAAFDVAPGEALFLRGPSGCGKSTLLSLLAGVLVADHGTTSLLGQDWRALSAPGTAADTYLKLFRHNAQTLLAGLKGPTP